MPESVTRWRLALAASDAVLIASPEYGFSLPGVLKNGIDWVIGSGELEQKVVGITAAVSGPERGRRGLQALRDTLSAVRATIVGGEPIAKGPGLESQVAALVRAVVEAAAPSRRDTGVDGAGADPEFAPIPRGVIKTSLVRRLRLPVGRAHSRGRHRCPSAALR